MQALVGKCERGEEQQAPAGPGAAEQRQHGRARAPLRPGDRRQPRHRPGAGAALPGHAKPTQVGLCGVPGAQGAASAEVSDPASIKAAAARVGEHLEGSGLNLLINNAAIARIIALQEETLETMRQLYTTNTIGPMLLGQAFLPLLKKAAQESPGAGMSCSRAAIINMSSAGGSIGNTLGWDLMQVVSYRCSKAALNMLTKCQSLSYQEHGILCVALHPGWVQTDMGSAAGHQPPVTVDASVRGMLKVLSSLSEKDTGTFLDWEGKVVPW
ncbi:C-signal-like isoform X1 [Pogoniulus pusillus]|uniref:C-signal-like isoform X1 n=2 Tax=Pogoniulus pusillus TaxID=488313 RepID=UPI0030B93D63